MKRLLTVIGLISALGGAFAVLQQVDGRYATAAEVEDVEQKIKVLTAEQRRYQIRTDMKDVRSRLWAIEDRWAEKYITYTNEIHNTLAELKAFMTPEAREQFRLLEVEYADLEAALKALDPPKKKEASE